MILRTDSNHDDFKSLIRSLDDELTKTYGEAQAFFDTFNTTDAIRHVVVAYYGKTPVGCGAIKRYSENTVEIKRMFVDTDFRGQGISRAVLEELEKWALELEFSICILETGKAQLAAIGLYKRCGYIVTENYGQYVGIDNSICMRKVIDR